MIAENITPVVAKGLGTALFLRKQQKLKAQKAEESVDYLEEKGVFDDPRQVHESQE